MCVCVCGGNLAARQPSGAPLPPSCLPKFSSSTRVGWEMERARITQAELVHKLQNWWLKVKQAKRLHLSLLTSNHASFSLCTFTPAFYVHVFCLHIWNVCRLPITTGLSCTCQHSQGPTVHTHTHPPAPCLSEFQPWVGERARGHALKTPN